MMVIDDEDGIFESSAIKRRKKNNEYQFIYIFFQLFQIENLKHLAGELIYVDTSGSGDGT